MIDPLLTDCRRIFLRGLSRRVRIGIHDFERAAAQRILFNIDLYVPLVQTTPQCDRIDEVVDYDFVRNEVTRITERGHIDLQETLCDAVLNALLAHPLLRFQKSFLSLPICRSHSKSFPRSQQRCANTPPPMLQNACSC